LGSSDSVGLKISGHIPKAADGECHDQINIVQYNIDWVLRTYVGSAPRTVLKAHSCSFIMSVIQHGRCLLSGLALLVDTFCSLSSANDVALRQPQSPCPKLRATLHAACLYFMLYWRTVGFASDSCWPGVGTAQ